MSTPKIAYGKHPDFNEVICVEAGRAGYSQTKPGTDPVVRNKELGVSEERAKELIGRAVRGKRHFDL